jgi:uncharacterized phage protein (TIGR01671 family)
MREIKFKAFVKKENSKQYYSGMYDVKAINFTTREVWVERGSSFAPDLFSFDEIELLQYIGGKDKNKNDVYEGNIYQQYQDGELVRGKIIFYGDHSFRLDVGNIYYFIKFTGEVIGNIYESPELLKE